MGKLTTKVVSIFSEKAGKYSVNSACVWYFYQEKIPNEIKQRLKK